MQTALKILPSAKAVSDYNSRMLGEIVVSRVADKGFNYREEYRRILVSLAISNPVIGGSVLRKVIAHIPKDVVIGTVNSDKTNFSKLYARKALSSMQTQALNDLTEVWFEMRQVFGFNDELINEWVETKIPALGGQTPAQLLPTSYGRAVLRECLERMKMGDFE